MNPGMTEVVQDPIVQALVEEGETAVEPLLQCLVEDNRLTRTQFTAGMDCVGPIIPVYEAAYTALFGILKLPGGPYLEHGYYNTAGKNIGLFHMSLEDRKALASQLRATWQKEKPLLWMMLPVRSKCHPLAIINPSEDSFGRHIFLLS